VTTRASLDSNILVYAELEPETPKGARAQRVIEIAAPRGVITAQSLLEFIAVVRRRRGESLPSAMAKVEVWSKVFEVTPTTNLIISKALEIVRDHHFQVWDAVIWSASRAAGATIFLSEDLEHGIYLDGLRAANPFALKEKELSALFGT